MKKIIRDAINSLNEDFLKKKSITLGFDGCSDNIYRVVKKSGRGGMEFFSTIEEFSGYIAAKSEISCSIELINQSSKAGGNSTIFANAISKCGVNTSIIGLFGKSRINDIFEEVKSQCRVYSYHKNALAFALEFNDGKIILYPKVEIEGDVWQHIIAAIGEQNVESIFTDADMLGLVNWSELEYSTYIWKKIFGLLSRKPDKQKQIIVDLSDCSRNDKEDLKEMLVLLEEFSKIRKVILSLNESEAKQLYSLYRREDTTDFAQIGKTLKKTLEVDRLVLHSRKSCYTFEGDRLWAMPTQFVEAPKLLTGAGDNFNAGYALGCLLDLSGELCNALGNAASSYYISHGKSPDLKQLKEHLHQWSKSLE